VIGDERWPDLRYLVADRKPAASDTPAAWRHQTQAGFGDRPFFGVVPEIVDADGKVLEGECQGNLGIAKSWPGMMRTVYGDPRPLRADYFSATRASILR